VFFIESFLLALQSFLLVVMSFLLVVILMSVLHYVFYVLRYVFSSRASVFYHGLFDPKQEICVAKSTFRREKHRFCDLGQGFRQETTFLRLTAKTFRPTDDAAERIISGFFR